MKFSQIDPVTAAVLGLADRLRPVDAELLPLNQLAGRILAEPLVADRDSPPLDVSAMDGYALRLTDLEQGSFQIAGRTTAGTQPLTVGPGEAIQIFTGAAVPIGADCVVPRELTNESEIRVELNEAFSTTPPFKMGQNIRYRGENARQGNQILAEGSYLNSPAVAAVASVAPPQLQVFRRVRVAIVNTGDELVSPGHAADPWQIRDSNGPTLAATLARGEWLKVCARVRAADQLTTICETLENLLPAVDAVIVTGGVSVGDTDHVPAAITKLGGEIVFHRLPIRPGKPVLGATTSEGKLIIGLPGNPVSVAVTANVIALPLLRKLAGFATLLPSMPRIMIAGSDDRTLQLQWYRLVEIDAAGDVRYVENHGSGDLISMAHSIGFVTIPPGGSGPGPWPLTLWN